MRNIMQEEMCKTKRTHSEETKRKIGLANSISLLGKKRPEAVKRKISNLSLKSVAKKFGVALGTASRIKNRETWLHV